MREKTKFVYGKKTCNEARNPISIQASEMRSWSDSDIIDDIRGNIQDQDIGETHHAVKPCCTSCNETARHSRGLEGNADQSPSNSRARVQGGPLTDCGMATRRTQTSGSRRRPCRRDRARGGSQIRVDLLADESQIRVISDSL